MLMPYGQKRRERSISIDIYALRAKEKTKLKHSIKLYQIEGLNLLNRMIKSIGKRD